MEDTSQYEKKPKLAQINDTKWFTRKISKTDSISLGKWKSILNINHSGRLKSVTRVALYLEDACPFNNGLKLLN